MQKTNKRLLSSTICLSMMSYVSPSLAAPGDTVSATIQVNTTIASADFKVRPVGKADFSGIIASLNYDEVNDKFSTYNINIESTFTTGLKAQLLSAPNMTNGVDNLPIEVSVDGIALSSSSSSIDSTPPAAGVFVAYPLDISVGTYTPVGASLSSGTYSGSVQILFEDAI